MCGNCSDSHKNEREEATEVRASQADEFYCSECQKSGLKVSSWQDFSAYMEFVDGKIEEAQLSERAKTEMLQFYKDFGKYLVIEKEDSKHSDEEEERKKRAKRATKIYKEICKENGLTVCFFHGFISWSEYVEGKIGETEFYERARSEVGRMAEKTGE